MYNDEIVSLKEELLKEIRDVEQKLNLQIMVKSQEMTNKNNKFVEEFNTMVQNNKSLLNSITSQKLYFDKINDFDNFRKKTESMVITHEIRINNSIQDIKDIKFKFGKEISDNFNVPGFIGPSCKYRSISSYLSSNINEIERIRNDNESIKRENKDIKKKVEDMLKTVLNLVDGSSNKCIEYVDKKTNQLEEIIKKKIDEFSDKILSFRSVLMSQEKIKEIHEDLYKEFQNNNYNKKEIDDLINNTINNFGINLDNFKTNYNEELNNMIKINVENLGNEIKENAKSIKDIKIKLMKINQTQNPLFKNNSPLKNLKNNNTELNINYNNKNNFINSSYNNNLRINKGEEEKYSKFKNFNLDEKNKTIDSMQFKNKKNSIYISSESNLLKQKANKYNIDNYQNKYNEDNKKDLLNNSLSKIEKYKQRNNDDNFNSEENKNSISDYKNILDTSKNMNDLPNSKRNTNDIKSPNKTNSLTALTNTKNKKIENRNKKRSFLLKKDSNDNQKINFNNLSNMIAFGMNNEKTIMTSIESESNIKTINNESNRIIKIIDNKGKKNGIKTISKKEGYSLRQLASIGFDEKANEVLPSMGINQNKKMEYKNKKQITPVIKNVFHQNYQLNLKNNKMKDNLSINTPVKIMSSFGRTGYIFYDKKEEGINNLINKGIKNTIKKYKNNSFDLNIGLSPVTKIKVYGNI